MDYKKYAKVLFQAFLEKSEKDFQKFFQNFIEILKKKEKIQILPKILKEVEKELNLLKKKNKTEIILKSVKEWEKFKNQIEKYSDKFNLKDYKIIENKNIVGGFILKNAKYILDNSYKQKLIKLYKKLIKS